MPIDKVGFSGLDHTLSLSSSQSKRDKVPNELTESSDNEISNASKYMIGAAALAGVVALGIIGHKNNWWRKASQAAEDLKPKIPQESPEPQKLLESHKEQKLLGPHVESPCGSGGSRGVDEVDNINNPQVNNNNASKVKSKSSAADSGNPKPSEQAQAPEAETGNPKTAEQAPEAETGNLKPSEQAQAPEAETGTPKPSEQAQAPEVQTGNPHNVDTQVDYSDISKIEGERFKYPDGSVAITQTDKSGNVVREFYSQDGTTVSSVTDYNPTTGMPTKRTSYINDDTVGNVNVAEYNPQTGELAKCTFYMDDGRIIIYHYDSEGRGILDRIEKREASLSHF